MGAAQQGASATQGRWLTIPRTLCFVFHQDAVLLMKRGPHKRIFPNQYNGLGGHIERDEDPLTSARREIHEESGLDLPASAIHLAAVHHIDAGETTGILLFVFVAHSPVRQTPLASEEGTLHWVAVEDVAGLDVVEDVAQLVMWLHTRPPALPPRFVHVSYDTADQILMRTAGDAP